MWTASTAFTSFIITWVPQWARTLPAVSAWVASCWHPWEAGMSPTKKTQRNCNFECKKCLGGRELPSCHWADTVSHSQDSSCLLVGVRQRKDQSLRGGRRGAGWENTWRQSCTLPERVNPCGAYSSAPTPHLQKLQKTQVDYVNADTQWRDIYTGTAGGSFRNDMSTAVRVGPTGAWPWHVHGGCCLPTGFLLKTWAQGALTWQGIFCQGSSFVFFFFLI